MSDPVIRAFAKQLSRALAERDRVEALLKADRVDVSDEWAQANDEVAEASHALLDAIEAEGK